MKLYAQWRAQEFSKGQGIVKRGATRLTGAPPIFCDNVYDIVLSMDSTSGGAEGRPLYPEGRPPQTGGRLR